MFCSVNVDFERHSLSFPSMDFSLLFSTPSPGAAVSSQSTEQGGRRPGWSALLPTPLLDSLAELLMMTSVGREESVPVETNESTYLRFYTLIAP